MPLRQLRLRSLAVSEIIYYKVDVGCRRFGILPCRLDFGFKKCPE
jgi:hypothetical protein